MSEQVAPPPAPYPGQPQPAVQAPPPAPEPPKKSGGKKVLGIVAVVVLAVVAGVVKFGLRQFLDKDEAAEAKVGDCIADLPEVANGEEKEGVNAKVVECTSTDAVYNVVGRVDNQTEEQAKNSTECEKYVKEGEEYWVFTSIKPGSTGYLLCLTKKA